MSTAAKVGDDRLAYSIAEAVRVSGIGRTTIYALIKSGDLKSRTIGRRRLIPAASLCSLVEGDEVAA